MSNINVSVANFLLTLPNRWFSATEVGTKAAAGKNITGILNTLSDRRDNYYCQEVIVTGRQKRNYYGYFENPQLAIDTKPPIIYFEERNLRESTITP